MPSHKIPDHVIRRAEQMCRDENLSFNAICTELGVSFTGLKRRLDPGYRAINNCIQARRMRRTQRYSYERHDAGKPHQGIPHDRARTPPHVLAERDAVINAPRTITSAVLGDPLPGRSALDRRANL